MLLVRWCCLFSPRRERFCIDCLISSAGWGYKVCSVFCLPFFSVFCFCLCLCSFFLFLCLFMLMFLFLFLFLFMLMFLFLFTFMFYVYAYVPFSVFFFSVSLFRFPQTHPAPRKAVCIYIPVHKRMLTYVPPPPRASGSNMPEILPYSLLCSRCSSLPLF